MMHRARAKLMGRIESQHGMPVLDVFAMLRDQGMTWQEIADELGISLSTVHAWRGGGAPQRAKEERVAITRRVVEVAEGQGISVMRACHIVAGEAGLRWTQVRGVYNRVTERGYHRRAKGRKTRPVTLSEIQRIGAQMQAWRRRGRGVKESLQLTATNLGRSVYTVRAYWYEGIHTGRWADPGKAAEQMKGRRSLGDVMGGTGL